MIRSNPADHYAGLWTDGRPFPDAATFLKAQRDATPRQRVDVLLVDQLQRWRNGAPRCVEDYLREFPEVAGNREFLVDLVYGEILLTLESDKVPDLGSFLERFPDLREELLCQFEVAEWLQADTVGSAAGATKMSDPDVLGPKIGPSDDGLCPTIAGTTAACSAEGGGGGSEAVTVDARTEADTRTSRPAGRATGADRRRDAAPDYVIELELGRGGMGVVYKARDLNLNRPVAMKMIRDGHQALPEHLGRLRIEAEAVARLRHPNIVQIFRIGEQDGLPFVAFEYLEGGTLAQRLASTPQPPDEAAGLLATLAEAVHAAHRAGIVHRDLKPSNVLFDGEGNPKIADFGLAKRLEVEDGDTRTGQVMGTPSYMAPEQARGRVREIGPATDVYALGAILYEMLTGRPPFKGMSSAETLRLVQTEDPVLPSRLRPRLPRDLETICLKCLAKEPPKRYESASALAVDLRRYLAGEPIRARRTPPWERAAKWARRHPATAVMLSIALVTAATLIGLSLRAGSLARDRAKQEDARIERLRGEVARALFQGQYALAQERWDDVRGLVFPELSRVEREPRLADLKVTAEDLLGRARRGLDEQRAREQARARYRRFLEARDEALFLDTRFAGIDGSANLEATCRAARAGLGVFGTAARGDDWDLSPLPRFLSDPERAEVEGGFYELLLVLADALAQSPGADARTRAEQSLAILDRAVRLRPSGTRAYHLRRAALLRNTGDAEGAAREESEADRLAPADAFDFFLNGRERSKRQEWSVAIRDFEAALQRQPDHFWAQCLMAICHLQTRQPSKARPSLNTCLLLRRDVAWLYLLRGIANAQGAELAVGLAQRYPEQSAALKKEAASQFEAAEEDHRSALALLKGRPDEAVLRYALLVNRGLVRLEQGQFDGARSDLLEAIRLDGGRYEAYSSLGEVYRREGRTAEATEQFDRAIALRPGWAPLYRSRAEIVLTSEEPTSARREAALRDLDDAIRRESPGHPLIASDLTKKARLLHQAGRDEEALASCDSALGLAPRDAEVHRLRVRLLLALRRYDDLVAACDAALAAGPSSPSVDLYEIRGMARDHSGDFAGAIADYTAALALQPDVPRLLTRRGWSYLLTDAPRPALHDFDAALRLDPSLADAYGGRGTARVRLGDYREAAIDAEGSLARGTPTWRMFYNAARVYAQASSAAATDRRNDARDAALLVVRYQDRALALLRRALEHLPDDRRAIFYRDTLRDDPALQPLRRRLRTLAGVLPGGG